MEIAKILVHTILSEHYFTDFSVQVEIDRWYMTEQGEFAINHSKLPLELATVKDITLHGHEYNIFRIYANFTKEDAIIWKLTHE